MYFRDRNAVDRFLKDYPQALEGATEGQDFKVITEIDCRFDTQLNVAELANFNGVYIQKGLSGLREHMRLLDHLQRGGNICDAA